MVKGCVPHFFNFVFNLHCFKTVVTVRTFSCLRIQLVVVVFFQ